MKITDFALIFIGITLPIIIVVYVNVSFTIKAEEQEIYYKKIVNSAARDAAEQMKEIENSDTDVDYGYSGKSNNKVSVNAQVGVDTFFNSLYKNFGIEGNDSDERYLQLFVPAIAVVDYNGVQISSIEKFDLNGKAVMQHALKPKRYYSYSYSIVKNASNDYKIVGEGENVHSGYDSIEKNLVEFTQDDYITVRGSYKNAGSGKNIDVKSFYLTDSKNNDVLCQCDASNTNLKNDVITFLQSKRKEVIAKTISDEMEYATNNNNFYASEAGITYSFTFPTLNEDTMDNQIENVGFLAFIQGISIGNKYLNATAYSAAKLTNITRYYLTTPNVANGTKYNRNLYHKDINCPEYRLAVHMGITPAYVSTKQQAASVAAKKNGETIQGFYPCPICNP